MNSLALPALGKQKHNDTMKHQKDEGYLSFVFFAMIQWEILLMGYYFSKCTPVFITREYAKIPYLAAYMDVKPPEYGSNRPLAGDAPATESKSGAKQPLCC